MSSPQTPRHSPHPSLDFHSAGSFASYSPQQDRRQSKASSYNDSTMDLGISGPGAGGGGGGGLGNLADELAGAFSDAEDDYDAYEEEQYDNEDVGATEEARAPGISLDDTTEERREDGVRDSGVDIESPSTAGGGHNAKGSLGPPAPNGRGHRRKGSEYDGSEFGSESDLESPGMPPRLVEKLDEVESLARRGAENNGSAADGAVKRVTESLRDLGSQAGVEGGATRSVRPPSFFTLYRSAQSSLTPFPLL